MEELEKDINEWKNNTVLTLLSRLGEKKVLESQKNRPVTKAEYQTMQTHSFLDKVYDGKQMNLFGQIHGMGILKMILLQFR